MKDNKRKIIGYKTIAGLLTAVVLATQNPNIVQAKPTQATTVGEEARLNGGEFNLKERIEELKKSLEKQSETGKININYLFKDYIKNITIMGSNVTIQFHNGENSTFGNINEISISGITVESLLVNGSGKTSEPFELTAPEINVDLGDVNVKDELAIIDFSRSHINEKAIKKLGIENANKIMLHGALFTKEIADKISSSSASSVWLEGNTPYKEETPVSFMFGDNVENLYFNVQGAYVDVNSKSLECLNFNPNNTIDYSIIAPNIEKTGFDNLDYNQSTIGNLDEFDLKKYIEESIKTVPGKQEYTYDPSVSYGYVKQEKVNELLYNSKVINISNYGNLSEKTIFEMVENRNSKLEEIICPADSLVLVQSVSQELLELLDDRKIIHPYTKEHLEAKKIITDECRTLVSFMPGDEGYIKEQDEFPNTDAVLKYFYNGEFTIDEDFTGSIMDAIKLKKCTPSQYAIIISLYLNTVGVDSYPFALVKKEADDTYTRKYCVAISDRRYITLDTDLPTDRHWVLDEMLFENIDKDAIDAFGLPIDFSLVEERGWNWTYDDLKTVEEQFYASQDESKEEGEETPIISVDDSNEIEELYKRFEGEELRW